VAIKTQDLLDSLALEPILCSARVRAAPWNIAWWPNHPSAAPLKFASIWSEARIHVPHLSKAASHVLVILGKSIVV
jgi:hypothetical protein